MAEGPSGPDFASMFALINASRGQGQGSGASPLLACILPGGARDVDVGVGVSCRGKGLNGDGTLKFASQRRGGLMASLCNQMGLNGSSILEDCKKAAQNAGVMYAGNVTNGAPVSSGLPAGGGSETYLG